MLRSLRHFKNSVFTLSSLLCLDAWISVNTLRHYDFSLTFLTFTIWIIYIIYISYIIFVIYLQNRRPFSPLLFSKFTGMTRLSCRLLDQKSFYCGSVLMMKSTDTDVGTLINLWFYSTVSTPSLCIYFYSYLILFFSYIHVCQLFILLIAINIIYLFIFLLRYCTLQLSCN